MSARSSSQVPRPPRLGAFEDAVGHHLHQVSALLTRLDVAAVEEMARILDRARRAASAVFTLGNGGSAATATHLASDLSRAAPPGAAPLRAFSLTSNLSLVSGLANDFGYESVFVRQLAGLRPGDVVIGISASGDSENCVRALVHARDRGAVTVGLLGFGGGRMKAICDHSVHVACDDYGAVEDAHLVVCHALVRALRAIASPKAQPEDD
jgi:D-sedoheptulose 7-phosphate isomerase